MAGGPKKRRYRRANMTSRTSILLTISSVCLIAIGGVFIALLTAALNMSVSHYGSTDDLEKLLDAYDGAVLATHQQARFWFLLNIVLQAMSVVIGIIATMMMALQNTTNAHWMK